MNIKGIGNEPLDNSGLYSRKTEGVEQPVAAQQQHKIQPQTQNVQRELTKEELSDIVDKLNSGVRELHERLSFSVHEKTQRVVVKIVNTDTNEVIREIPSKDAIKLLEHIQDFLGMMIDESR